MPYPFANQWQAMQVNLMEDELGKTAVYNALIKLDFVQQYIEEFKDLYPFNEDSILIEYQDQFGQCTVWLGFEDQFAIRDASGQWREASAGECCEVMQGTYPGMHKLIN
ncbi:hypothetical protein PY479_05150 [Shewanella sp. A32]|uniref:hypothetical protein n=1 Tax=Shewanella sp. A32 TaxID=3031327 RepID=UPI0023B89576|nr:hypothetical protein [Shewanella sp. A32]MDF0533666.1 hypothetical protein [Shewanella sp. A32]